MRIEGVEAVVAALALRSPVRSAGVTHADRATLFLRVSTDEGSGWGECSAHPDAREPDPTVDLVEPAVVDRVVAHFFETCDGGVAPPASSLVDACVAVDSVPDRAVGAALEMAVLDVELRSASRSLAWMLGTSGRGVETGALVGIPPDRDLEALLESVSSALDSGARRVRLKIEPGWDRRPIQAVRERFPDAVLQADANGSFEPSAAAGLRELDAYRLRCLEQPFAPDDLEAHRRLTSTMETPVALDESLWSPARIDEALAAEACRVACLKPGRLGGVFATLAAARACARAGVECFVGGFFESGLGRSVNAAVAGAEEFSLPGDLGDPAGYLEASPFSYLRVEGGLVQLSDAPGLGSEPLPKVLSATTVSARWLPYRP